VAKRSPQTSIPRLTRQVCTRRTLATDDSRVPQSKHLSNQAGECPVWARPKAGIIAFMPSTHAIRVAVHGAAGRVGREVVIAIAEAPDMELMAAIDRLPPQDAPLLPAGVPYFDNAKDALSNTKPEVVVDFTNAEVSVALAPVALAAGVRPVIGSTGFLDDQLAYIDSLCHKHHLGAVYAPNFTIGAVLLAKLSAMAARFFEYAELTEEHHEQKLDAPSGTALSIAKAIHEAHPDRFQRNVPKKEPLPGTRGADYKGITIHSTRMPGRLAHHQVTFGAPGQTLTLRHDTINRECYMPGVLVAIRKVREIEGLAIGLENLLDL
jgi:4-hydroxy-tetrahydrodipicolinate reductase